MWKAEGWRTAHRGGPGSLVARRGGAGAEAKASRLPCGMVARSRMIGGGSQPDGLRELYRLVWRMHAHSIRSNPRRRQACVAIQSHYPS